MHFPQLNWLTVLTAGVAIFILGGLWYSVLFGKVWMRLIGKTEAELKASAAGPVSYLAIFLCGLITSTVLAILLSHCESPCPLYGMHMGLLCWLGFAGVTSFGTAIFSGKPKMLWLIDSGYNLVSFVIAGAILGAWR